MIENTNCVREAEALIELRGFLEDRGIKTKPSAGKYEYFYAFLHEDKNGVPCDGLFIVIHQGTHFSWSRDGRHPIDDIPEAAQEITRIINEESSGRRSKEADGDGSGG